MRTQLSLAVFTLALALACATSPTGRRQLRIVPDDQLSEMGSQAFQDLKKKTKVSRDPGANDYVVCVARAVLQELPPGEGPASWDVALFEDDSPNAFALPGGKIGVHTGMLRVAENPAQLAAVIGHEVAHVLAAHPNERASQQIATQGALSVVGAAAGENSGAVLTVLGAGAQAGILLPFSRAQEREADVLGLDYMARAGFDPAQAVALWQNMERATGGKPPEFLSTHPSGASRIRELSARLPEVRPHYEEARARGRNPRCGAP